VQTQHAQVRQQREMLAVAGQRRRIHWLAAVQPALPWCSDWPTRTSRRAGRLNSRGHGNGSPRTQIEGGPDPRPSAMLTLHRECTRQITTRYRNGGTAHRGEQELGRPSLRLDLASVSAGTRQY
jgi:hypothetical protein